MSEVAMTPGINEALNFLDNYAPTELLRLQQQYPSRAARQVLLPNHAGVSDPALEIRGRAMQTALKSLAEVSLRAVFVALDKLRSAERLENWASGTTALGALVSTVAAVSTMNEPSLNIGAALFTLLASLVTILAKQRRRALLAKDLTEHTKTLSNAQDSAAAWLRDLDIYLSATTPASYDARVSSIIDDADKLLKEVNLALIELGLERVHA